MPETIQAYLDTVAEQIRWKRARPVLVGELERHLEDQKNDFIKDGKTEAEAERLAVEDMGDPVTVGTELDAVHRPKPQWGLLALTLALAVAGMVLRAAIPQQSDDFHRDAALVKALTSLGLGTAALLGMYFLDVSQLARHARFVYISALAAGLLTLWLSPTYAFYSYYTRYVVLLYPLAYTFWLYSFRGMGWRGLALSILGGVPLALVCCRAPSMMGLTILLFSGLMLTLLAAWQDWFGTGRKRGLCAVLAVPVMLTALLITQGWLEPFLPRLKIALHPELDKLNRGFMGWMIHRFWEDVPPLRHYSSVGAAFNAGARIRIYNDGDVLPIELSHDLLPACAAVVWGWLPFLLLLSAVTALLVWLLVKGLRQRQQLGRLTVLAVALTLGFQTLFSVATNLGFVLFSASLPLVVGDLQTVLNMAMIGLALSVFRGETIEWDKPAEPFRQWKRLRIRLEYQ